MSVLDSLEYNIKSLENIQEKTSHLSSVKSALEKEVKEVEQSLELVSDSRTYYTKAVDVLYKENVGALKDTLNVALQYIMYDKRYAVDLVLDDKRGTKTLEIAVTNEDTGLVVDVKDGCGQGVRTIISAVLKTFYLLNQGSHILLLDEKYSALSAAYTQRFFEFLNRLADEKGMIFVLITHDPKFTPYARKTFLINDGKLRNLENITDED